MPPIDPRHSGAKPEAPAATESEPLVEVIENLVPADLHAAAWAKCSGAGWLYGHSSGKGNPSRFWKMDLDGDAAFDAIWEHARPRCEALAGTPLRVIRQYANGHTYGLGGSPHLDDARPGTFTLLYYPNPEWKDDWEGETMFYDRAGEVALCVALRPNRAVFFDSRTLHNGRAPGRICTALRVTVAYKLESAGANTAKPDAAKTEPSNPEAVAIDGARRVYHVRVPEEEIRRVAAERLEAIAQSVRLPGFRPGKIPAAELEKRYGVKARAEALRLLAAAIAGKRLPAGSLATGFELRAGAASGDVEIAIAATHLPDLPDPDFSAVEIERLIPESEPSPEAAAKLRGRLKSQVLDRLEQAFVFPAPPHLALAEFNAVWKAVQASGGLAEDPEERKTLEAEFRRIAERRVRLGIVVAELARRYGIQEPHPAALEDAVIDKLLESARVVDRPVSGAALREMPD